MCDSRVSNLSTMQNFSLLRICSCYLYSYFSSPFPTRTWQKSSIKPGGQKPDRKLKRCSLASCVTWVVIYYTYDEPIVGKWADERREGRPWTQTPCCSSTARYVAKTCQRGRVQCRMYTALRAHVSHFKSRSSATLTTWWYERRGIFLI